jgi:hypothetical protein
MNNLTNACAICAAVKIKQILKTTCTLPKILQQQIRNPGIFFLVQTSTTTAYCLLSTATLSQFRRIENLSRFFGDLARYNFKTSDTILDLIRSSWLGKFDNWSL